MCDTMRPTLKLVLSTPLTPTEAYLELKKQPRWFLVFTLIAVASAACVVLSMPFTRQVALMSLSGILANDQLESAVSLSERVQYLAVLVAPVGLLGKWLLAAAFLYAFSIILDVHDLQFRRVFAAVVHAEIVLVLMSCVNVLLLYLKGPVAMKSPIDLQSVAGLDILLSNAPANVPLFVLLNGINPFSVWYIVILSTGVSVMTGLSKFKSGMMVTILWLIGLGCQFGVAAIGNSFRLALNG